MSKERLQDRSWSQVEVNEMLNEKMEISQDHTEYYHRHHIYSLTSSKTEISKYSFFNSQEKYGSICKYTYICFFPNHCTTDFKSYHCKISVMVLFNEFKYRRLFCMITIWIKKNWALSGEVIYY